MKKTRNRNIISVITAATGEAVSIGDEELNHALKKHFHIPKIKLIEIIEQILINPTAVYLEEFKSVPIKTYHLFYKLEDGSYLVVVIKLIKEGSFFSTIYPTGKSIRNIHKKLKKIKI